ncbi:DUF4350 domain-containing protein [uncultured Flavobacterium sp.]|uniref:DUF4350 domain-containing protein n=1 Tax=uncultured Flavobacterium sp. TaxID=165435 RepID=UPI0025EBECC5|nr:DUF4350 domain-containing protein [uncultured Flavobacterium sp.]
MSRKTIFFIALPAGVLIIITALLSLMPKEPDWTPTYNPKDKIPLGTYVLDKEAPFLFKNQEIKKFSVTAYEYFDQKFDHGNNTYKVKGTYLDIKDHSTIDEQSAMELLYFAEHGNTVFLGMQTFPQALLDTLDLQLSRGIYVQDSVQLDLQRDDKRYWYGKGMGHVVFDSIEKSQATILGFQETPAGKKPNFIRVAFGDGQFFFHTQPAVFSNYHLLKKDHYTYAEDALSYIPKGSIYWHSGFRNLSKGTLSYIKGQPALNAAMWLGIIGILIFIFFNAKRKQRIIPEIKPLANTTVDFTKTIGNLYYQEGDHHTIIEKKIIYFLEHIRNEYLIDTYALDDDFTEKLHLKTGKQVEDIQKAIQLIKKHRHQFQSTEADVIEINKAIEKLRL